ncbi:MAG: serine/threonine protein kinase [Candidatus Solibacter usitatus]|nr:serine/threonine protein kinase [Candidatus Solibacter usitatus]
MNPEQWPRLEELFHRAAELQEAERAAFLDAECAGPEMRAEVESLLAHDASPGAGFQDALALEAEATAAENSEWLIGRHIGPYRVTGIIGEGGMGAVYSAIRDDDHYHKEVAIKLVRHGLESSKLLERFRAERQILATLEHPYVARMLDGGATADGFPYLVMERIKGLPITRYAQERRLSIETRLRLFLQVCEAVQYAHANLIVHRDIKTANISVTADGVPKLLDFGIARLLTPDRLQSGEQATSTLLLTPDYASPEQVRGQVVTTATDIYSLGAVLYELLTGHSPHRLAGRSSAEALSSICTEEPEVPSKAAESSIASARQLAGDLDNIVLMALRKEPERRYRSVEQFCEDIQRHLAGRPVIARADTLAYRAARFAGRNRWAIAAVTAVMVTLASSVVVSRRAAERAERRFAQVRHLAETVLFGIYESIEPLAGSTPSRQIIVKNALEYLRSLSAEAASDASLLNELAEAYRKVGDVQSNEYGGNLGDARGAMESYHNGVALARSAVAAQPGNASFQATLGTLLWSLSRRQFDSSEMDAARRSGEEAIRLLERSTARDSSDATALEALGQAYLFLGAFSGKAGTLPASIPASFSTTATRWERPGRRSSGRSKFARPSCATFPTRPPTGVG